MAGSCDRQRLQGAGQLRHFLTGGRRWLLLLLALVPVGSQPCAAPEAAPSIPLQRNLRFVVRPTLLGLLPPPDPLNFGEAFVRVQAVTDEHVWLRYELKEQLERDSASGALYLLDNAPPGSRVERVTRIRRGNLSTQRSGGDPGLLPPMLWADGDRAHGGGLLWLDRASFELLRGGGEPAWALPAADAGLPRTDELARELAARRSAAGPQDGAVCLRLLEAGQRYRCRVNGAAVDLPALRAVDSLLLAEYWILDDPQNPLLLKLNYLPLQDPGELRGWAAMLNAGGGCAITQIDF